MSSTDISIKSNCQLDHFREQPFKFYFRGRPFSFYFGGDVESLVKSEEKKIY